MIYSEQTLMPVINSLATIFKFKLISNYEFVDSGNAKMEIDFILNFEEYELLLIIEAKGGRINCKDGIWSNLKTGNIQDDPFKQARKQQRTLKDLLDLELKSIAKNELYSPCCVDYLVWFTENTINCPVGSEGNYLDFTANNHKVNALKEFVDRLIREKRLAKKPENLHYQHANDFLSKHTISIKKPGTELNENIKEIELNTKNLINPNLTSVFLNNNHVLVTGTAGTGKSYYASYLAKHYDDKNCKVLYLCYNILYGIQINQTSQETENSYYANDLLSFYHYNGIETKLPDNINDFKSKNNFYQDTIPNRFLHHIKGLKENEKFDVVIVDEGQDFNKVQITSILKICKSKGKVFIFKDDNQKLYTKANFINTLNDFVKIEFKINFRNPQLIFKKIQKEFSFYTDIGVELCHNSPEGKCATIEYSDETNLKDKLKKEIEALLTKQIDPGEIWILVGDNFKDYLYLDNFKINDFVRIKLINNTRDNCDQNSVVNLSRPSIIKGLEFKIVMVVDSEGWNTKHKDMEIATHIYTALSRSTDKLYIFKKKLNI